MAKFKLGDRVKITHTDYESVPGAKVGEVGVITEICYGNVYGVTVKGDNPRDRSSLDGGGWAFREDEIKLVRRPMLSRLAFWRNAA